MRALAISLALWAGASLAQETYSGSDPWAIGRLAADYGSAETIRDSWRDPLITAEAEGAAYVIQFYGCRNGRACTELLFVASFRGDRIMAADLESWNRNQPFGRALINEAGDATLEMDVVLGPGLRAANMQAVFETWFAILDEFRRFLLARR